MNRRKMQPVMGERRNIILLAMSDYRGMGKLNSFFSKDTGKVVVENCDGQLEPIIKLALSRFPKRFAPQYQKEVITLEVIMLCTEKTRCHIVPGPNKTSVDYFKDRVRSFSSEAAISFTEVPLDEDKPAEAINEAVTYIRSIREYIDSFWIDTHGGFRDVSLMLEAIVSLLKVDQIVPDRIWGIQFTGEKNYIVDQRESFSVFDFVAGMNEFINYGSVKMLRDYYGADQRREPEGLLLKAMQKVSEGVQESDPVKYVEGLDQLGKELCEGDQGNRDILLLTFRDYLKSSYGDLLDPGRRTITGIIAHCLHKGFIMQALTFIESMMPGEFVRRHIICYEQEELETVRANEKLQLLPWKSNDNLAVDSYVSNNHFNAFFINDALIDQTQKPEIVYIKALLSDHEEDKVNLSEAFFAKAHNPYAKWIWCNLNKHYDSRIWLHTEVKNPANRNLAGRIMRLHLALKKSRNALVHCNPERADSRDLEKLIALYLRDVNVLFSKYPVLKA